MVYTNIYQKKKPCKSRNIQSKHNEGRLKEYSYKLNCSLPNKIQYKVKSAISILPIREINSYYRQAVPNCTRNINFSGTLDQNYIFFGHESLIILNSLTYSCEGEYNIETLQGSQQRRYSFCLPFLKPSFLHFLTYLAKSFQQVKSTNPQLQFLVESFSQCRDFLGDIVECSSYHPLSCSNSSPPLESISIMLTSNLSYNSQLSQINLTKPLRKCIDKEETKIKGFETLLEENTHLFLDIHLEYKDQSSTSCYSHSNFSSSSSSSSSNWIYNDIEPSRPTKTNPSYKLSQPLYHYPTTNHQIDKFLAKIFHKSRDYSLDYKSSSNKENFSSLSNSITRPIASSQVSLKPISQKKILPKQLPLHFTTRDKWINKPMILFLNSSQTWYTLIPLPNNLIYTRQFSSLSLGFSVAKTLAFKFASRNQSKYFSLNTSTSFKDYSKQDSLSWTTSNISASQNIFSSLINLTKSHLSHSNFKEIDHTSIHHQLKIFVITSNLSINTTLLNFRDFVFIHITPISYNNTNLNLSATRYYHSRVSSYIFTRFMRLRKKKKLEYMRRTSKEISPKTRQIILAKRRREETYYECRRKPPMDKFDPELIASQALNEDGVLLRQVQDLNFYQRQVMYKVCIERGLQAPIYIALNALKQKGRSVYAAYRIEKGEFVLEYKGDLLDKNDYDLRERHYLRNLGKIHCFSTFTFSFKINGKMWYIDATSEEETWGAGRLVNHSHLNPNLCVSSVFMCGLPRLFFYARREIQANEELLVDYGEQDPSILSSPYFSWLKKN